MICLGQHPLHAAPLFGPPINLVYKNLFLFYFAIFLLESIGDIYVVLVLSIGKCRFVAFNFQFQFFGVDFVFCSALDSTIVLLCDESTAERLHVFIRLRVSLTLFFVYLILKNHNI